MTETIYPDFLLFNNSLMAILPGVPGSRNSKRYFSALWAGRAAKPQRPLEFSLPGVFSDSQFTN